MYWKQVKQVMALSVLALLAVLYTSFSHADEGGKLTLRTREIDLFVDVLLVNEDKEGSSGVYEDANTALMTAQTPKGFFGARPTFMTPSLRSA